MLNIKFSGAVAVLLLSFISTFSTASTAQNQSYKEAIYNKEPRAFNCVQVDILTQNIMASSVSFENKLYYPGEPKEAFELKLTNKCFFDVLAVVAQDGQNVVNASPVSIDNVETAPGFILPANRYYVVKNFYASKDEPQKAFVFKDRSLDPKPQAPSATNSIVKEIIPLANLEISFFKEYEWIGVSDEERVRIQTTPGGDGFRTRPSTGPLQEMKEVKITTAPASESVFGFLSPKKESVSFEKENKKPFKKIAIDYDSRDNLVSKGIMR